MTQIYPGLSSGHDHRFFFTNVSRYFLSIVLISFLSYIETSIISVSFCLYTISRCDIILRPPLLPFPFDFTDNLAL